MTNLTKLCYKALRKMCSISKNEISYKCSSIYICGGYTLLLEVKECYKLDLNNTGIGWVEIAPLLKGRFKFQLLTARGLIYAIGGEGPLGPILDEIIDASKIGHCSNAAQLKKTLYSF